MTSNISTSPYYVFDRFKSNYKTPVKSVKTAQPQLQPNNKRVLFGNTVGLGIGLIIPISSIVDDFTSSKKITNVAENTQTIWPEVDNIENTKRVADEILKETGLKNKGVKIFYADKTGESQSELKSLIDKVCPPKNFFSKRMNKNMFNMFSEGANAAFLPGINHIITNSEKLYSNVYHEIGHAMNAHGKLSNLLFNARVLTPMDISAIAPVVLGVGLAHKVNKDKPKSDKNGYERTMDFISQNAVGLTALSVLPLVSEEGLASIRGIKAASRHLETSAVKQLRKNYLSSWRTYGWISACTVLGVGMGIKAANYIKYGNPKKQSG